MQTRILSGFFRLAKDHAGGLAGVLYGAPVNPETRSECVWCVHTSGVPSMVKSELLARMATCGTQKISVIELRSVDATLLQDGPEIEIILSFFRLRGTVFCYRPLPQHGLWCSDVVLNVPVPLLSSYDPWLANYILSRFKVSPEVLRDRILAYVYLLSGSPSSTVRIRYWGLYSEEQRAETMERLAFAGDRIIYG